ncbi:MAG: hypothetical protein WBE26_00490 [Phycisphaerae bacterium]
MASAMDHDMRSSEHATGHGPDDPPSADALSGPTHHTRREVVRRGVKLAFVAPVLSTFFAKDAYAFNYSCYPPGHACGVTKWEDCCTGECTAGVCPP